MTKSDSAVSEVVGVLLLLTITLILVSLVAVAMNNAVSTTEKPVAPRLLRPVSAAKTSRLKTLQAMPLFWIRLNSVSASASTRCSRLTLRGSSDLKSYSGLATISLGDRFYDLRTGSPISSGEIAVS